MPFPAIVLRPGPAALAAACYLAGFSDTEFHPAVTDKAGVTWSRPSTLQIILAVGGGESSGHSWCWSNNPDGSHDYGWLEINDLSHPVYFGPQLTGTQLSAWNYAQNSVMAFALMTESVKAGHSPFKPWNAYTGGGYLNVRYLGRSWMDWGQHGINSMWATCAVLTKAGKTKTQALNQIASVDNDPLKYW